MKAELDAIKTAFDNAHIPYAYNVFPTDDSTPALPYCTGFVTGGQTSPADDENYFDTMNVTVILFTRFKDPVTEDNVRAVLKSLEVIYEWNESYSTDDKMYAITYTFQMNA